MVSGFLVLIIDDVHPKLIEGLIMDGFDVHYHPEIGRAELISVISNYHGLIVRTKTEIDANVLSHATKLKFIGRAGSGLDNIDVAYCRAKSIVCVNASEANADAVGEHTIGLMLALMAKIAKAHNEVRALKWQREANRGLELKSKTLGIIGYGNTGKALAKKLSGFELKILAYDKYLSNYSDSFASQASMDEIFQHSDVVSVHVPLTPETTHMVNEDWIGRFSKPIYFFNTSRGKVINTADLVNNMKCGKILGVGLDVLENEKIDHLTPSEKHLFEYLISAENAVITPHVAGWTVESYERISEVLLHKIKALKF
jgi:D-3-phosphoglycerate dehydrogenase